VKYPLGLEQQPWANKNDEMLKNSMQERLKPFELVTDEETAEAFDDFPSGPASQILPIGAEKFSDQFKRLKPNHALEHDSIEGKGAKAFIVAAISFVRYSAHKHKLVTESY